MANKFTLEVCVAIIAMVSSCSLSYAACPYLHKIGRPCPNTLDRLKANNNPGVSKVCVVHLCAEYGGFSAGVHLCKRYYEQVTAVPVGNDCPPDKVMN